MTKIKNLNDMRLNIKQLLDIKNLLIIIPFVFGLFYDFAVFGVAIIFLLIIFKYFIKNKNIKINFINTKIGSTNGVNKYNSKISTISEFLYSDNGRLGVFFNIQIHLHYFY